jgi:heptosyltransferase-2
MGLLSVHGKQRADELKIENQESQPAIYARMLGIEMGKPALHLPRDVREFGGAFARRHAIDPDVPLVGLNTGAGGRWTSKQLPVDRTVALARLVAERLGRRVRFLVLGGESEVGRNRSILDGMGSAGLAQITVDAGCDNPLLPFGALVGLCDVLVTSDSLALHMAVALDVRVVAFFAPTSAAEIELYGLGEKVVSTAADYCSYSADADNSSITPERLRDAVIRQLDAIG